MLIEVENLTKRFPGRGGFLRRGSVTAVAGLSLGVEKAETVALVGESGCGKSTAGRLILRLLDPDEGVIRLDGCEIQDLAPRAMKRFRRRMQVVFQNPLGAMNPIYTVEETLADALRFVPGLGRRERRRRAAALLDQVGLGERFLRRRRTELSGGELQRVSIARALAPGPDFIFLDEPTSALDVSVRGQILNLLLELQERHRLAYLFVSHDLSLVQLVARRVLVMYRGAIVESAPAPELFADPRHPYTEALLAAARFAGAPLAGEPEAEGEARGCRFAGRCPLVEEACRREEPPLLPVASGHFVRCRRVEAG